MHRIPGAILACLLAAACGPAAHAANPLSRFAPPPAELVNGRWNGVDLERRSNCTHPQNEGTRGTYAQFDVSSDAAGSFTIGQSGITGLDCTYLGRWEAIGNALAVRGTMSCSDGKRGDFRTTAIDASASALTIHMDIALGGAETCSIEAVLGMARFAPRPGD